MMKGVPPSEDPVRRNAPTFDKTYVAWDGEVRGPDLPELRMEDEYGESFYFIWPERTREWWAGWRTSPQAMVMYDSDWEHMLETALLHARFWGGTAKTTEMVSLAGEIRRRVASFGSTFEDRLKLRIVMHVPDETEDDAKIKDAAEKAVNYMERLNRAAVEVKSTKKDKA